MSEATAVWQHPRQRGLVVWPRSVLQAVFEQWTCLQLAGLGRTRMQRVLITPAVRTRRKSEIHPLTSESRIGRALWNYAAHGQREHAHSRFECSVEAQAVPWADALMNGGTQSPRAEKQPPCPRRRRKARRRPRPPLYGETRCLIGKVPDEALSMSSKL